MEMTLHCRNHWDVANGLRNCTRCGQVFCPDCLVQIRGAAYCASCKNEELLDVRSGVALSGPLELASILRRFAAVMLDGLIIGIPFWILYVALIGVASGFRPDRMMGFQPLFFIPSVIMFIYEGVMITASGQTLGKKMMRIKVVRADGTDLQGGQGWGRTTLRTVIGFVPCFGVLADYLPAFFSKDKTTLHDMVVGTRVVNWN